MSHRDPNVFCPATTPRRRAGSRLAVGSSLLLGWVLYACSSPSPSQPQEPAPPLERSSVPAQSLLTVGPATLHLDVERTGNLTLAPDRTATVRGHPGVVKKVLVTLGQTVTAGQPLALVESRDLALARIAYADAVRALSAPPVQDALPSPAPTDAAALSADASSSSSSALQLSIARQRLLLLGESPESLKTLVHPLERDLSGLEVKAPIGGEVVLADVSAGMRLTHESVLFVIADRTQLLVKLEVQSEFVGLLRPGLEAKVASASPPLEGKARVSHVSSLPGAVAGLTEVTLELPDKKRQWRVGLPVTVTFSHLEVRVPLALPRKALLPDSQEVEVNVGEGVIERRKLELGLSDNDVVEVRRGLRPGELVLEPAKGAAVEPAGNSLTNKGR